MRNALNRFAFRGWRSQADDEITVLAMGAFAPLPVMAVNAGAPEPSAARVVALDGRSPRWRSGGHPGSRRAGNSKRFHVRHERNGRYSAIRHRLENEIWQSVLRTDTFGARWRAHDHPARSTRPP